MCLSIACPKAARDDDDGELITPTKIAHLRSALEAIPSDERDLWVRIGHALATLPEANDWEWCCFEVRNGIFDYFFCSRLKGQAVLSRNN